MFLLESAAWLFYAAEEDGQLPVLFGALVEAVLAVLVSVIIYRLTDSREIDRRVTRLEDAMSSAAVMQQATDARLEALEDEAE